LNINFKKSLKTLHPSAEFLSSGTV